MNLALGVYCFIVVVNGVGDWFLAHQFDPDMTTKQRIIHAIKFGVLWPLYWIKAILGEFL